MGSLNSVTQQKILSEFQLDITRTKMAKKKSNKNMKKGKAHHWSVPVDQKVAKKVYVPTVNPEEGQQDQEQQKSMFHPANPGDAHPQKNKENLITYISFFIQNLICPLTHFCIS